MFGFLAQLLAWCFDVWGSYGGAILLFTLIVMAAVTPFTVKGMRSAAEMSRLQPEMKKLQDQYKNDRVKQNEEMQALFKEHGVNPLGGCLPTLLPLPIFFIIFRLLRALSSRHNGAFSPLVRLVRGQVAGATGYVTPHYLTYKSTLNLAIIHTNGALKFLGMDLALTARDHHASVGAALPFYGLIVVMTGSQYWQQRQINQRNPAAANANPQMKLTMQLFPAFYALISLSIPASVVLYLLLSGLFRMAQNALSYRFDPVMARAAIPPGGTIPATAKTKETVGAGSSRSSGSAKAALTAGNGKAKQPPGRGGSGAGSSGSSKSGSGSGSGGSGRTTSKGGQAAAPAAGGGFMAQLRAQAAEARARADAKVKPPESSDVKPQVNGKNQPKSPDPAPPPREAPAPAAAAPTPAPAPVPEPVVVDEFEAAPIQTTPFAEPPSVAPGSGSGSESADGGGNGGASPLSIRPAGRRKKGGR